MKQLILAALLLSACSPASSEKQSTPPAKQISYAVEPIQWQKAVTTDSDQAMVNTVVDHVAEMNRIIALLRKRNVDCSFLYSSGPNSNSPVEDHVELSCIKTMTLTPKTGFVPTGVHFHPGWKWAEEPLVGRKN